jgi:hypothetical protein
LLKLNGTQSAFPWSTTDQDQRGNAMSVVSLRDRRIGADRRAVARTAPVADRIGKGRPTRRQIWAALILYCAAFWGMVGYAIYDIFGR